MDKGMRYEIQRLEIMILHNVNQKDCDAYERRIWKGFALTDDIKLAKTYLKKERRILDRYTGEVIKGTYAN